MRPDLQLALIGYGLAGRVFHAPLIQHTPGLVLHSIVSSQRDTLLRTFSDVHVRATPQEVFDDPAVDAVVIATPNEQHAPLAIAALAAGKHVLVDKPFALDVAEAETVLAAARDAGRIATVFQNRRFDADFLTLQALLAEGTLGDVAECHAHFDRYRPQVRDRWREQDGPAVACGTTSARTCWTRCWCCSAGPRRSMPIWPCSAKAAAASITSTPCCTTRGIARSCMPVRWWQRPRRTSACMAARPAGSSTAWMCRKRSCAAVLRRVRRAGASIRGMASWCAAMPRTTCSSTVDNLPGDYRRLYAQFAAAMHGDGEATVSPVQALQLMRLLQAGMDSAREGRRIALGDRQGCALHLPNRPLAGNLNSNGAVSVRWSGEPCFDWLETLSCGGDPTLDLHGSEPFGNGKGSDPTAVLTTS
jgi:hypothetical protein